MSLPKSCRQLTVTKLGNKFREVTEIRTVSVAAPGKGEVLLKPKFVGINASDIIFSAGGYDPSHKPPFIAGLEALGEVVAVGEGVDMKVGQAVVSTGFGCFAEYVSRPAENLIPVPSLDPALMSIVLSGLTASIALKEEGDLKPGETVLVTAAAGGTGQFAVQLAKMAGCHVVGTCSSPQKAEFLKSIGCDRVINYNNESIMDVLQKEYPNGVDVVYESVGKDVFDTCVLNLAVKGRLIVIGQISNYERPDFADLTECLSKVPIAMKVLFKNASVRGFFLPVWKDKMAEHVGLLMGQYAEGKLKVTQDNGKGSAKGPFKGLEKIADAVDYMYARGNIGKIIVEL